MDWFNLFLLLDFFDQNCGFTLIWKVSSKGSLSVYFVHFMFNLLSTFDLCSPALYPTAHLTTLVKKISL